MKCSSFLIVSVVVLCLAVVADGFLSVGASYRSRQCLLSPLFAKSKASSAKGFGKKEVILTEPVATDGLNAGDNTENSQSMSSVNNKNDSKNDRDSVGSSVGNNAVEIKSVDEAIMNTKMFKQTRRQQEILLQDKIQKLKEEEDLIASDPSVGAVPELIANRMITRIAAFFGIPVFGGLTIFVGAYFLSKQYDTTIPPTIIAYATQLPFILGLVGITYGILSASWDEEPGSLLGIKEFKVNLQRIKDGLARTRETEQLRGDIEIETEKLRRK